MWKPISLNEALRAFASGQNVMVADFTTGKCLPLSEVLRRFKEGAVMFAEDAPQKYNPPDNATEAELVDWIVNGSASEPEPEPPKVPQAKKQLDEAEKAYQTRKISDLGKLRSLRDAGWSAAKIADEFRCSKVTVYNALKKLEAEA